MAPAREAVPSERSSPPKVSSCGAGDNAGRRGACLGIAASSRWRRSSSSLACSLDIFLLLDPDALRSVRGSVDLERRRNPRDFRFEETVPLLVVVEVGAGASEGERPGVRGLEVEVAIGDRVVFLFLCCYFCCSLVFCLSRLAGEVDCSRQ